MRRWLRVLVCLLLICSMLVNISTLRAKATGAGLASVITGVSSVSVAAPLAVGASLIALGVMADNTNPLVFENVVNTAVDTLSSAGQYVKDGAMELIRTVDELGNQAFYVAGDFLESLRSGLFNEGVLIDGVSLPSDLSDSFLYFYNYACDMPYAVFITRPSGNHVVAYSSSSPFYTEVYTDGRLILRGNYTWVSLSGDQGSSHLFIDNCSLQYFGTKVDASVSSPYSLSLGQISTVPIDGTSARDWASSEVADRNGLYVKYNNDPEPPDDNNGKWFWKLALPTTFATLLAMSQADEWSGETPEEFPAGDTVTEFEILDRPEIDGYQGIELSPVTNPDVNPDTGEGADPTEPGEPTEPSEDESTGSDSETNWFEKIWKSIVELPNSFKTWFEDLKKGIEELPSKFSQWASDTILAIQNLPQAFANLFADVVAAIQSVPQTIKDFFTPKSPDNHDKFALADLSKFFPFCIPFDLYDFFTLLNAEPVAPVLSWEIKDLAGQTYSLDVDLSQWDSVALLFRRLQLFLFITGLAAASRKFIKW